MTENLPLIPEKGGAGCTDVRPMLREVFREYDSLPPLAPHRTTRAHNQDGDSTCLPTLNQWIDKYDSDRKEVWQREGELKQKYAKRISREPLPNIYKLQPPSTKKPFISSWMTEQGIIDRKHLIPSVVQNSNVEDTLWVQNILNRSSGDLSSLVVRGTKVNSPVSLRSPKENISLQSYSIGELRPRVQERAPPRPPPPPAPDHVLLVPSELEFVNFTIGDLHSQSLRLINVSKFEVQLSVRPPSSRLLNIELCSNRGLTITSGAAAVFKVNFRPRDVRVLRDVLVVRVSTGKVLHIPISCYMQPPFLEILVPAVSSSILLCTPGQAETGITRSSDCLELGARLLGDVHCVSVMFRCETDHASFFLLTEEAWLSFSLDVVTTRGSLLAAPFVVWPAWWRGGGSVRGCIWCRPDSTGLQEAALRIIATTAVVRPLYLIADAVYFRPEHITIEAQDKDYDICDDDDPACEYYVHLGTAFPRRSLSATVQLVNHSPVMYTYYWSVRPWGVCSCWEEQGEQESTHTNSSFEEATSKNLSDGLCVGAKEARDMEQQDGSQDPNKQTSANRLRVEPARGSIAPRSTCAIHVCAPDVGEELGIQRAVLMLILKGIPKESLPGDYDPMIIRTDLVNSDPIPGVKLWTREICEIVCAQMEVWWDVAPVRFVIDPPILHLDYSRRVSEVEMTVLATQMFGCESIECEWRVPGHLQAPPTLALTAAHSCPATLRYQLPELPNHFPDTDVIALEAADSEWEATTAVTRRCATRHPALRPARLWLGLVAPGASMHAVLEVFNDTCQHICWWATPFSWYGENPPSRACGSDKGVAREPCARCQERACTCAIIKPARGALHHHEGKEIEYAVYAPEHDGCVATLIAAQRTSGDVARVAGGAGSDGRASLVSYRVLAPRLVLRVIPCHGDKHTNCECCALDGGLAGSKRGTATLRPRAPLWLSRRSCYRMRFTNTTPLPTIITWDPPLEEDALKVVFRPKQFEVGSYANVEIQVVVEARKVCRRRLFLYRAQVKHAYKPLYLVIDTAISGLEIDFEIPLGGDEKTDTTAVIQRMQAEVYPWEANKVMPQTFEDIFAEEDRKRVERTEDTLCRCKVKMAYVPPPPRPRPPRREGDPGDYPPVDIVLEPPPLTRVCPCHSRPAPALPEHTEPYCLQFHRLPLRTVRTRTVVLRNKSVLCGTWRAALRNWPRVHVRSLNQDQWAGDVRAPGVCVQVTPSAGVLAARGRCELSVRVYADCWGIYRDQLAIKIDNLEALVLDLWIEAVGPPLQFALSLTQHETPVLCWMSSADPERALRAKNVSRSELVVCAYTITEHEHPRLQLPFRLYLRLFDVEPATCPCMDEPEEQSDRSTLDAETDTGVELYLAPDYGPQASHHYTVTPETTNISPGEWFTWDVQLLAPPQAEVAPPSVLMLRALPLNNIGEGWVRVAPPAQAVRLRQAARAGRLRVSCSELRVRVCALDLPQLDVLRVRKRFRVQNVGNGLLEVGVRTEKPWIMVLEEGQTKCGTGCACGTSAVRKRDTPLELMPWSSLEMCVEVVVKTTEACPPGPAPGAPPAPPAYPPHTASTTQLQFYDEDNILKTLSLILELEYPVLSMEPATIDFGFVTDGDTRKSYYSIGHSSRTVALDLWTEWVGGEEFRLHPRRFTLYPGKRERIYIQYTAKWCSAPVEGWCVVRAAGGAGAWCRAAGGARAAPARDLARRAPLGDTTDDTHLLPPVLRTPLCL